MLLNAIAASAFAAGSVKFGQLADFDYRGSVPVRERHALA
jgi:hypothetical protein